MKQLKKCKTPCSEYVVEPFADNEETVLSDMIGCTIPLVGLYPDE